MALQVVRASPTGTLQLLFRLRPVMLHQFSQPVPQSYHGEGEKESQSYFCIQSSRILRQIFILISVIIKRVIRYSLWHVINWFIFIIVAGKPKSRATNFQSQSPDSQEPDTQQQTKTHIPAAAPITSCVVIKREPKPSEQKDGHAAYKFPVNLGASTSSAVSDLGNLQATVSLTRISLQESECPFYSFNMSQSLLPIAISTTNPVIDSTVYLTS